jgi:hypothetical protein
MFLLGGTVTKFLATLAAIMTVTAGLPSFQCRCPDGRVKLFCQGIDSLGCCGTADESPSPEAKSCCEKKANEQKAQAAKKHSCCTGSECVPQQSSGRDGGSQIVVKATCCVKTLVADSPVYSVADPSVPVHHSGDTLITWELVPLLSSVATATLAAHSPPGFFTSPPDLVIILCHFTC